MPIDADPIVGGPIGGHFQERELGSKNHSQETLPYTHSCDYYSCFYYYCYCEYFPYVLLHHEKVTYLNFDTLDDSWK